MKSVDRLVRQAVYSASRVGAVAQLGERLNGIQEVVGSIPIGSTNTFPRLVRLALISLRLVFLQFTRSHLSDIPQLYLAAWLTPGGAALPGAPKSASALAPPRAWGPA